MRRLVPLAALALCGIGSLRAQAAPDPGRRITGTVRTAAGAPLAAAVVVIGGARTRSGSDGEFSIRAGRGAVRLVAAGIGFAPETLQVASTDARADFRLAERAFELDPITVASDRPISAASSAVIRELDIRLRPRESSQELLRLVPGLVIAQHAGGGKAEQVFLRGFDADHGTDVAVDVDGVPVNMVSHGHGQGYADLHFLMPEVVEEVEVRKGPYDARDGDFATAGAVSFRTRDRIAGGSLQSRGGSLHTVHAVGLVPFGGGAGAAGGYAAASAHYSDGPTLEPQGYRRLNGFARFTAPVGAGSQVVASGSGFDSRWDASGQVPMRAVRSGAISRFGSIDPSEGGSTSRYDLSLALRSAGSSERRWLLRLYAVRYDFRLFSNFTFFLNDSIAGDGIEQRDQRTLLGAQGSYAGGLTSAGFDVRHDLAQVALNHAAQRRLLDRRVDARVREQRISGWVKQDLDLAPTARLQLGVRGDFFRFEVADRLRDGSVRARDAGRVSPKANLAIDLSAGTTLFANAGLGLHSNDARAVLRAPAGTRTLPAAAGFEIGARRTWTGGSLAAALWALDLQSEQVYIGDEGTTEASGRTRRAGIDVEGRVRLAPWLWADSDLTLSRGRFRDEPAGADRIPLLPSLTSAGGLTVRELGPLSGGLRYRIIGARPADETGEITALGSTLVELFGSWRVGRVEVQAAVDNLFDVQWNEAQFATTSRLREEPGGITELHFTPGARRTLLAGVSWTF